MKLLVIIFTIIAVAFAIPASSSRGVKQFGGHFGIGHRPHGGGFSGSSAHAQAQSGSFNNGFGGFSGSSANAAASSGSFGFGR
jgi:hypothetical protein